MKKLKRGQKLVCVPCGREVVVDDCGISGATIWCCGKPMTSKAKAVKKATKNK